MVLDFFAHNGGPNQLFSVPGPAKLILELLAAIMAAVIGRQFAAGIAFLITKNHLDLMLQQLTHQSGGDRTGGILDQKHRNVTKVHLGGALCIPHHQVLHTVLQLGGFGHHHNAPTHGKPSLRQQFYLLLKQAGNGLVNEFDGGYAFDFGELAICFHRTSTFSQTNQCKICG